MRLYSVRCSLCSDLVLCVFDMYRYFHRILAGHVTNLNCGDTLVCLQAVNCAALPMFHESCWHRALRVRQAYLKQRLGRHSQFFRLMECSR